MSIISIVTDKPGNVGVVPRRIEIKSTDSLATITTAGYLSNSVAAQASIILPTDIVDMIYLYNPATNTGVYEEFIPSFSNGVITLVAFVDPGNVLLPVVNNHFAVFNGTSGQVKDAGYLPSNAAKTNVVMANGATVANHIMASTDTAGTSGNVTGTVINDGSVQAGRSGVAGSLVSYPVTAAKGSLQVVAAASTGDTVTAITNATMGQATTFTIPDPSVPAAGITVIAAGLNVGYALKAVTGGGVLTDVGFGIYAGTTDVWGGGSATHDFTATGLPASSNVVASIATLTSSTAAIVSAQVLGANSLRVIFTADPGANTKISWFATKV